MTVFQNGDAQTINDVAKLHRRQFKNYDIVSSCSTKLIKSFYEYVSGLDSTVLITEMVNNQTAGFIYVNVGNTNPAQDFVKKNLFRVLLNPFSFAQAFRSLINRLFRPSNFKYENELVYIAVAVEYAGQGIATRLIEACEAELRKRMINEYYLQVYTGNYKAVRLYKLLGFEIVKRLNRIGSDKFIMKKKLA